MNNPILTVFSKEVIDNFRDRRSFVSGLSSSIIGPALILLMIVVVGKSLFQNRIEKPLQIHIAGAENAPALVAYLEQNNVELLPAPPNPEEAVRNGDLNIVMIIPENYTQNFTDGIPAPVQIIIDSSRQSALADIERARELLNAYTRLIRFLRLTARGVDPNISDPLAIERVDVATPQSQALLFLNAMPYFIVMVVFIGGAHVVVDSTAGERERSSLEPLLINPAARWQFVIGKLMASLPFAMLALLVNLAAFALAFNVFPIENYLGFQLSIDLKALTWIFIISLPMILLASGLQMIIASFARSYKEAQTYVGFLPLIPALPGLGLAFLPVKADLWKMAIPTFGQQLLINQFLRGEAVNMLYVAISCLATTAMALVLIWVAIRLFKRESLIFGTR